MRGIVSAASRMLTARVTRPMRFRYIRPVILKIISEFLFCIFFKSFYEFFVFWNFLVFFGILGFLDFLGFLRFLGFLDILAKIL
jgi:hypothetical protein